MVLHYPEDHLIVVPPLFEDQVDVVEASATPV